MKIMVHGCSDIQKIKDAEKIAGSMAASLVYSPNSKDSELEQKLPCALAVLLECNILLVFSDINIDPMARILVSIAKETGKKILHHLPVIYEQTKNDVMDAICSVSGYSRQEISEYGRKRDRVFLRMIFAHEMSSINERYGLSQDSIVADIANFIDRDRTTVLYYLRKFDSEFRYNRTFSAIVKDVQKKINYVASH